MRLKLMTATVAVVLTTTLSACAGTASSGSAADYPEQDLDWTVAFGPGGGNDLMSRKIVQIIEDEGLYEGGDITVENREGGSGATGWGYLLSKAGDPYNVSTTSGSFLTTPLQADPGWTWESFTPVGLMATDDALFLVPGESDVQSFDDWVAFAKDKGKVVVGGIGTVNVDFILHALIAEAKGYEIEYVPFNEEGQLQTSLLSGALDGMVSNTGSILGQIESGDMRPLLFTGQERLESLPDVPTGEELGIADLPSMPRGLILPPDMPQEAVDYWVDTMKKVVETPAWQEFLEENSLAADVRWEDDFTAYLKETTDEFESTLKEQGAL